MIKNLGNRTRKRKKQDPYTCIGIVLLFTCQGTSFTEPVKVENKINNKILNINFFKNVCA